MSLEIFECKNNHHPHLQMIEVDDEIRNPIVDLIIGLNQSHPDYTYRSVCSTSLKVKAPYHLYSPKRASWGACTPMHWTNFIQPYYFCLHEDGMFVGVDWENVNCLRSKHIATILMKRWDSLNENNSTLFKAEKEILRHIFQERGLLDRT